MTFLSFTFFITIFLVVVYPLHVHLRLHKSQLLNIKVHQLRHIQKQLNAQKLSEEHSRITNVISQLEKMATEADKKIALADQTEEKINILQSTINQQRSLIQNITDNLEGDLDDQQWSCPFIPPQNKQKISEYADSISTSLKNVSTMLESYDPLNVPARKTMENEVARSEESVNSIKTAVGENSQGKQYDPNTANKSFQSNLAAPGWFLGSMTQEDLQNQIRQRKDKYDQLNTCPISKPFYTGVSCLNCEGTDSFFSMTLKRCTSCKDFNEQTHVCNDKQTTGEVQRPSTAVTGPVTVTNIAAGKKIMLLPSGKSIADIQEQQNQLDSKVGIVVCPDDKPFYNALSCTNCGQGQVFSVSEQSCTMCPKQSIFNAQNHRCQNSAGLPVSPGDSKQKYYSNLNNPNWASKNAVLLKTELDTIKAKQNSLECPDKNPFFNGESCIQCSSTLHFDFDQNSCLNCQNGEVLNKNLHKCVSPDFKYHQTNPKTAPNLLFDGRSKNEWMSIYYRQENSIDGIADCPEQSPYFDGTQCINCPKDHPLFNMVYAMCQICQNETYYDEELRECLTVSGNIADQTPTLQKMGAGIFT